MKSVDNNYNQNLEIHRLNFLAIGILNRLEENLIKLKNTFIATDFTDKSNIDFEKTIKTINGLYKETMAFDKEVMDALNG